MATASVVSQSVATRIEQLILDGALKPGKALPSERKLAEQLAVSRSMVREALRELRGRGVIETRQGKGSVIRGLVDVNALDRGLLNLFRDHERTLYDLLEVREQLEGLAASLAAERGNADDFRRIRFQYDQLAAMQAEHADSRASAQLDHAFHQAIIESSHNPVLIHTLNSMVTLMLNTVFASVDTLYHRETMKRKIDSHHRRIFQAIMAREPDKARRAAVSHIRSLREQIQQAEARGRVVARGIPPRA